MSISKMRAATVIGQREQDTNLYSLLSPVSFDKSQICGKGFEFFRNHTWHFSFFKFIKNYRYFLGSMYDRQ